MILYINYYELKHFHLLFLPPHHSVASSSLLVKLLLGRWGYLASECPILKAKLKV